MNLRTVKIIGVIFLFLLSFLWHFLYDFFPFDLVAFFFPVNESIWEHMKIIYSVLLVGSFFQWLLYRKYDIKVNNVLMEAMSKAVVGVVFYLLVFVPIYKIIGENMFFSIGLMLGTYILMEVMGAKILKSEEYNIRVLPVIIIVLGYVLFIMLTFYPPHSFLFFDSVKFGYGILK